MRRWDRTVKAGDARKHWFYSRGVGIGLAVIGLLMAGWGISRGEMSVVFEKAVNICMECIGIG